MRVDASRGDREMVTRSPTHRGMQVIAPAAMAMTVLAASVPLAPAASADSVDNLRTAVMAVRAASCEPLRPDPIVERTAENVNRSTDTWVDHTARAIPVPDPLPLLKDLGYGGNRATQVLGAGFTDAAAIKGLLLEGFLSIPDCSFTDYGVSVLKNQTTPYVVVALVLAGA